jgi:hypothetical protein
MLSLIAFLEAKRQSVREGRKKRKEKPTAKIDSN